MAFVIIPDTGAVATRVRAPTCRASSVMVAFAVVGSLASWELNVVASKLITPYLSILNPRKPQALVVNQEKMRSVRRSKRNSSLNFHPISLKLKLKRDLDCSRDPEVLMTLVRQSL